MVPTITVGLAFNFGNTQRGVSVPESNAHSVKCGTKAFTLSLPVCTTPADQQEFRVSLQLPSRTASPCKMPLGTVWSSEVRVTMLRSRFPLLPVGA